MVTDSESAVGRTERGIITLAFGREVYVRMGRALLRSIRLHGYEGPIAVVTDHLKHEDWRDATHVIPVQHERGKGVEQKLWLDTYSPFTETLFIDADSLVFRNADSLFEYYRNDWGFQVHFYRYLIPGQDPYVWIHDLEGCAREAQITRFPQFNGGVYWWQQDRGRQVFSRARVLARDTQRYGFVKFKSAAINEEAVLGVALSQMNFGAKETVPRRAMITVRGKCVGLYKIDVLSGKSEFIRDGLKEEPAILHFHVEAQDSLTYQREQRRLLRGKPIGRMLALLMVAPNWMAARTRGWITRITKRQWAFQAVRRAIRASTDPSAA